MFPNGYNASFTMLDIYNSPLCKLINDKNTSPIEIVQRFRSIDLTYQTGIYEASANCIKASEGLINLYNPQEVRNINDRYFTVYPLDLNRV